jgi:hypothetical protein
VLPLEVEEASTHLLTMAHGVEGLFYFIFYFLFLSRDVVPLQLAEVTP